MEYKVLEVGSPVPVTVYHTSYSRGHLIKWWWGRWVYVDDGMPADDSKRPCPRCARFPTSEGYDACLGHIPGVKAACCGHGVWGGGTVRGE